MADVAPALGSATPSEQADLRALIEANLPSSQVESAISLADDVDVKQVSVADLAARVRAQIRGRAAWTAGGG